MSRLQIDLETTSDIIKAIVSYNQLSGYFTQLDPNQAEKLTTYHEKILKISKAKYIGEAYAACWKAASMYVVPQVWSNTSGGWCGIGGSAMIEAYTVIFENYYTGSIFVYYGGELAYVANPNDKLVLYHKANGFKTLPGLSNLSQLDIVYKRDKK